MRKIFLLALGCLLFVVTASFAATFPTPDPHTLVSSDGGGIVSLKVAGDSGWEMILYCQDGELRGSCGNKFGVKSFEKAGDVAKYQIPADAVADGQIAFNFKKDGLWLLIPDCRVKTANQVAMGMSFFSNEIAESGGAHFVYTGGGIQPWSFVESGSWCDEGKNAPKSAAPPRAAIGTGGGSIGASGGGNGNDQGAVAKANNQSAAAAHNSSAASNQSASANNSSQANATSLINVNQIGGKGKKGGKNTAIVYAPNASQKVNNYNIKGNSADVKVYNNKSGKGKGSGIKNVITYVGPSYQTIHFGIAGAETYDQYACAKCHSNTATDDERARKMVLKQMSSAFANEHKKHPAKKGKK